VILIGERRALDALISLKGTAAQCNNHGIMFPSTSAVSFASQESLQLHYLTKERPPANRRPPCHRHAIPSGPWPWIDIDAPIPEHQKSEVKGWPGYPQALYQNWLPDQVDRAQIKPATEAPWIDPCTIYPMDVKANGEFIKSNPQVYYSEDTDKVRSYLQKEVGPTAF
jgi:hypothetical protein